MVLDSDVSPLVSGQVVVGEGAVQGSLAERSTPSYKRMMRVRWWIWSVLALCFLIAYFQRVAPGVVADRLMADFAANGTAVGLLAAIYFYMYAVMQVPSGVLADTLGVRHTAAIGAALSGVGSLIFALAPGLGWAYFGRFLVGLGVSVFFVAAMKFQGNWFRTTEYGFVSGMLVVMGNLGAVVATTPMALMAEAMGWRLSFVIIGVLGWILAVAAWCWVRNDPRALGLPSIHDVGAAAEGNAIRAASAKKQPFLAGARIVWRTRQTWAGLLAHFGLLGTYLTFAGLWAVPYLMHVYGMERTEASSYLMVTSLALVASAPLTGWVSDRLLLRRLPILAQGVLGCAFWLTLTLWNGGKPPVWALYPLFAAFGFSAGNLALILTAVKEANPPRLGGLAMGSANNAFLCAALLQPALGYVLDRSWGGAMLAGARVYPVAGYQVVLAILTALALAGLLGTWMLRETHCRNLADG